MTQRLDSRLQSWGLLLTEMVLIVASILLQVLEGFEDIREPELEPEVKANLNKYIKELKKEK